MKKIILLIISSVLSLVLFTACLSIKEADTKTNNEPISTTSKEQDIREIAFNQLTTYDKEKISGAWNDSKLSKITLEEGMGNIDDKSYIGKEVYFIDFSTEDTIIPSNMIVFLTMDSKKLLGYGKEQDIREIAFNQLTAYDKERMSGAWNDGKLSKITLKEGMGNIDDKSYFGKEVYLIDFSTEDTIIPNNMAVFLTMDSKKLLGHGYVQ